MSEKTSEPSEKDREPSPAEDGAVGRFKAVVNRPLPKQPEKILPNESESIPIAPATIKKQ